MLPNIINCSIQEMMHPIFATKMYVWWELYVLGKRTRHRSTKSRRICEVSWNRSYGLSHFAFALSKPNDSMIYWFDAPHLYFASKDDSLSPLIGQLQSSFFFPPTLSTHWFYSLVHSYLVVVSLNNSSIHLFVVSMILFGWGIIPQTRAWHML